MAAPRRQRYLPWRDALSDPGPVMIVDVDGVVATMRKFEPLLGDTFDLRRWNDFMKKYRRAALITRGARLVDLAVESGIQIVWSTTRPDQAAEDTWNWLNIHHLPQGPILTRHRIKDGTRPAVEVKVRQWYQWVDKYGDANPVVAWIDDDDAALHALPYNGCPTWHPMHLQRTINRAHGEPLMATLMNRVSPPPDQLAKNLLDHRAEWDARDSEYQAKQAIWWEKEQQRMAERRAAQRQRQNAGRRDADRRRR